MKELKLTLTAYRICGEAKLKRPAILKGLKPAWELPVIGKRCKVYELADGRLVLHMGELFCKLMAFPDREDMTLPYSALKAKYPERLNRAGRDRFVYADGWCTIYGRNEGYVLVEGLRENIAIEASLVSMWDGMYKRMRELSVSDKRFLSLGEEGCEDRDSACYRRMCEDIVCHYFVEYRDGFRKRMV